MIQETYNTILYRLTKFVEGHNLLKQFTHGNLLEMTEQLEEADYPLLHVIPESVQYDAGERTFTMKIVIADIAREIEQRANYQKEVLSDMIRIGEDLIAEIKNGGVLFGTDVELQIPVTFTPFLADYTHTMTGVTIDLSITFPYNWTACDIPAEWIPIGGGSGPTGDCCIQLQVNGVDNVNQNILDLVASEGLTIVDNGDGSILFTVTGGGGGSVSWGSILGTLSNQTDLQNALDLKADISSLAIVATSGDYNDLSNLPTIPAAQVNSDWNAVSGVAEILNKPAIPNELNDLSDVSTGSAAADDILIFDGTNWIPIDPKSYAAKIELDNLGDVDMITPQVNDVLTFNGTEWTNSQIIIPPDPQTTNICKQAYLFQPLTIYFANADEWTRIGNSGGFQSAWNVIDGNSGGLGVFNDNTGELEFTNDSITSQRCLVTIDLTFKEPHNHNLQIGVSKTIAATVSDAAILPQSKRAYHFDTNGDVIGEANLSFIVALDSSEKFALYLKNVDDTTDAKINYGSVIVQSNWY